MKKLLFILILSILQFSCADDKFIGGVKYRPYGLFNENECRNPNIRYAIAPDAVFAGVIFSEFLFIPTIYVFGYNLYEPVGKMEDFKMGANSIAK